MEIRITAKIDGFRRCGIAHSSTPTDYPAGTFTPAQIEELKATTQLIVEQVKAPQPDIAELLAAERLMLAAEFEQRWADEKAKLADETLKTLEAEKARLAEESAKALETEKAKLAKAATTETKTTKDK